jgi:hypothetical protein
MASGFHGGNRSLQDRFDTRSLADRIDGLLVSGTISERDRAFIEGRDMFFLAKRARRASTSKTRYEATTQRRSSWFGSARGRSTPTVAATSTATSSSGGRGSCLAATA